MHPRNPYRTPPDFNSLENSYAKLKPYLVVDPTSRRTTIDFQNEDAQRRLTEAIMHRDFHVDLNIPLTRLCPPVPNRMNYALWIQDIVRAHEPALGPLSHTIRGIDIGTGATAIYPFLVCKLEPTWEMIATELDEESFASAVDNVTTNLMDSRITVMKATPDGTILFPLEVLSDERFEFTMCNPPFYSSREEVSQSATDKERPPNAVCTGAEIEMIYSDGGEEGFVGRMVEESARFQTRCKWYTSMLGKMSSVSTIVEKIRELSITNYAVTEFVQGQTRRWAVAWSFVDCRLPDTIARIQHTHPSHALHASMPPRTTLVHTFSFGVGVGGRTLESVSVSVCAAVVVEGVLREMGVVVRVGGVQNVLGDRDWDRHRDRGTLFVVEATGDTWSRSARRSRARAQGKGDSLSRSGFGGTSDRNIVAVSDLSGDASASSSSRPALTCSCRVVLESESCAGAGAGGVPLPLPLPLAPTPGPGTIPTKRGGESQIPYHDEEERKEKEGIQVRVEFQWMSGVHRSLFESFVGHVGRKVGCALGVRG